MRLIGTLPQESPARAFGDHLLTLGINCSVEESREGWAVWVENDDHIERAKGELDAFQRNPDDPRYHQAAAQASTIRSQRARQEKRRRQNFIDVRTSGALAGQRAVPLTVILIAICLVVGFASRLAKNPVMTSHFTIAPYAGIPPEVVHEQGLSAIAHGQVWRLITPIFVHYDVLHILFNLLWLADLGMMIERRRGTLFLLLLVLVSALISNLAQYRMSGPYFGGMSGVVYALFGYAWMKGRYQPQDGVAVMESTVWLMLIWLGAGYVIRGLHIANTAHLVGLFVGMVFGAGPYFWHRLRRQARP